MKKYLPVLLLVLCLAFPGLRALAAGSSGLEGEYVDESDGGTLTVTADHWKTKVAEMESDDLYTAKKTGDNSYEIGPMRLRRDIGRWQPVRLPYNPEVVSRQQYFF